MTRIAPKFMPQPTPEQQAKGEALAKRINRLTLKPGERCPVTHRRFLGWKLVCGEHQLGTDGHWYNVAGFWTDHLSALKTIDDRLNFHGEVVRLVPVWRAEPATRKALRELVGALWNCRHGYNLTEEAWDVLCACHALLEEK